MFMQAESYEPQIDLAGLEARSPNRRRPALLGVVLVLAVLALVVVKYRTNWLDSLTFDSVTNRRSSAATQETESSVSPAKSGKGGAKHHTSSALQAEQAETPSVGMAVAVPPLQVDVAYSNGRRETLRARDTTIRLIFSPQTADALLRPKDPVYPVLAQQNNVQGTVVLLARIAKDGSVDSVQVLSGPNILASAAVEAVKQWRFKPRDGDGQANLADTRITVDFTISTPVN
jgi:TonB family protein